MSRSLSSDCVEMQTNGCQTDFNENDPQIQINSSNSIDIVNSDTSNKVTNVEASVYGHEIQELIIDDNTNFSSYDLSVNRRSNDENSHFYNNISSATMRFNMATQNETQINKQVNYNGNEDVIEQNTNEMIKTTDQHSSFNEQNNKKCPNFNICQGKGNINPNRKNHRALDNCPKKINKVDQSKILDENSSNSTDSSESEDNSISNNSIISIHTDDSEIKDMFLNAGIPRISSTNNIKQYVIY